MLAVLRLRDVVMARHPQLWCRHRGEERSRLSPFARLAEQAEYGCLFFFFLELEIQNKVYRRSFID